MNERIRELRAKAQELAAEAVPGDVPFDPDPDPVLWDRIHISYEKFAELIVAECVQAFESEVDTWKQMDPYQGSIKRQGTKAIKQHFGVEE